MSQILCWNIDYTPTVKPWSTVKCPDKKKVVEYLQPDSIILVSSDIWAKEDYRQFLIMSKIHYPNIRLGIVVKRKKKAIIMGTYLKTSEIENFIQASMRRHFKLVDHKKIVECAYKH